MVEEWIEGEARTEGSKHPRIEGEARIKDEAQDWARGGVWGENSVSLSPENLGKLIHETMHSGV